MRPDPKNKPITKIQKFIEVVEKVQNSVVCETMGILETDCKRHIAPTSVLTEKNLPELWERLHISSFGFTTYFVTLAPQPTLVIRALVHQYFTREWVVQWGRADLHKKLVAVILQMGLSSTILARGTSL